MLLSDYLIPNYDSSGLTYATPIGKSDHLTLLAQPIKFMDQPNGQRQHTVFDYRQSNIAKLFRKAEEMDWIVDCNDDLDEQWKKLHGKILKLMHDTIP